MSSRMEKPHCYRTESSVNFAAKLLRSLFILLYFHACLVFGNKGIPVCDQLWTELGNEMQDWRERCLDKDEEISSPSCRAEKGHFEERRRSHKKMCFYDGKR